MDILRIADRMNLSIPVNAWICPMYARWVDLPKAPSSWTLLRRALPFIGVAVVGAFILGVSMSNAKSVAERGVYFAATLTFMGLVLTFTERRSGLRANLYNARVGYIEKELEAAYATYAVAKKVQTAIERKEPAKLSELIINMEDAWDKFESFAMRDAVLLGPRNGQASLEFAVRMRQAMIALVKSSATSEDIESKLGAVGSAMAQLTIEARWLLNVDELHTGTQQVIYNMPFDPWKQTWKEIFEQSKKELTVHEDNAEGHPSDSKV